MDTRIFLASVLNCGVLDVDFLMTLMDETDACVYNLQDDIEMLGLRLNANVNNYISILLCNIADNFLEHVVKDRKSHFRSTEYQTFINYLDSHVWFEDENLNRCLKNGVGSSQFFESDTILETYIGTERI